MSFGPKLDTLPTIPPHGRLLATLELIPAGTNYEQEATIFIEEAGALRSLQIKAIIAKSEQTPTQADRLSH